MLIISFLALETSSTVMSRASMSSSLALEVCSYYQTEANWWKLTQTHLMMYLLVSFSSSRKYLENKQDVKRGLVKKENLTCLYYLQMPGPPCPSGSSCDSSWRKWREPRQCWKDSAGSSYHSPSSSSRLLSSVAWIFAPWMRIICQSPSLIINSVRHFTFRVTL